MYPPCEASIIFYMDRGLHFIANDLAESWVEDWAGVGLLELEALLAKHAAFLGYLDSNELEPS
jgi:hypothetical protein